MPDKEDMKVKYAVGSVAQEASKGADSLLSAAQEDVNMINKGTNKQQEDFLAIEDSLMGNPEVTPRVADTMGEEDAPLELPDEILDALWFSENNKPPMDEEQAVAFEVAVFDALVEDEPAFEFEEKIYSLDKAAKTEIIETLTEEEGMEGVGREKVFFGGFLRRLVSRLSEMKKNKSEESTSAPIQRKKPKATKETEGAGAAEAMETAQSSGDPRLQQRDIPIDSFAKNIGKFNFKGRSGLLSRLFQKLKNRQQFTPVKFKSSPYSSRLSFNTSSNSKKARGSKKFRPLATSRGTKKINLPQASKTAQADPSAAQAAQAMNQAQVMRPQLAGNTSQMRAPVNEGGMPVDTYSNIPPEEMAAAKASQLPDDTMEDAHEEFILDQALNPRDQDYLGDVLGQDERLSVIFDRVMDVATEFSGAGAVDGMGTGVSDSIPARLSDGEFVFTKKSVDQIGTETLQQLMDDAERAFDQSGGREMRQEGGMMMDDHDDDDDSKAFLDDYELSDEVKKMMIEANQMPSNM